MKWCLCLTAALFALMNSAAPATLTEEQQGRLLQALSAMCAAPLAAESREICDYVMREELDLQDRISLFDQFFAGQAFTAHHAYNLEAHLHYATADKERMARFAGGFAASSLRHAWQRAETAGITPLPALPFLESIFNKGVSNVTEALASGIEDILGSQAVNLAPFLTLDTLHSRETVIEAMQTCITLGVFSTKHNSAAWIVSPKNTADFYENTKVWLFDANLLRPEHLTSLESLFSSVPATLHGIITLFVPEATGFSAADTSRFRIPGTSLDIPLIDMEPMRDLSMYPAGALMRPIPEFTATVLERLATTIQTHQLQQRPDLRERVHHFFTLMTARADPTVVSLFPPDFAYRTPEERMAYLGFYWLANSHALLETAVAQAEQGVRAPLFALLLEADLCSEQGDTAPLFRVNPTGVLFSEKTALRRVPHGPGLTHVNGIAFLSRLWQYDMADLVRIPQPF